MIYLTELDWLRARDRFRDGVLQSMDMEMTKIYAEETGLQAAQGLAVGKWGARDKDLPFLFKALDVQFTNNMAYLGYALENKDDDQ